MKHRKQIGFCHDASITSADGTGLFVFGQARSSRAIQHGNLTPLYLALRLQARCLMARFELQILHVSRPMSLARHDKS